MRTRNVTPNRYGTRFITPSQQRNTRILPFHHQPRRRTTPLYPLPHTLPVPIRSMGTRSRFSTISTPSQGWEFDRNLPARPLNKVSTIPGYNFGNDKWTTTGWHQVQQQTMSPEVANLMQQLNCTSDTANANRTSARSSMPTPEVIPLITIDNKDSVLTENNLELNVETVINPNNHTGSNKDFVENNDENNQSPNLQDEASQCSEDSTTELLQDFNPNITIDKPIRNIIQNIPVDKATEDVPDKDIVVAPSVEPCEPTSHDTTPDPGDPTVHLSMETHEPTSRDLKNLSTDDTENETKTNIKSELCEIPGIKQEKLLDVKFEKEKTSSIDIKPEIIPKTDNVKIERSVNTSPVRPESPENAVNTEAKSESDLHDSSLDFTLIDAGLIKSLMASSKPKHAPKKRAKVTKRKTKKKTKKVVKCTPLDRNINATSKQLFEQLKNIKMEVKKENNECPPQTYRDNSNVETYDPATHTNTSAISSLDDLEIPELEYNPETPKTVAMTPTTNQYIESDNTPNTSNRLEINQSPTRNESPSDHSSTEAVEPQSEHDKISNQSDTESYSPESDTSDTSETDTDNVSIKSKTKTMD